MDEIEELIAAGESIFQKSRSITEDISLIHDTHRKIVGPTANSILSNSKGYVLNDENDVSANDCHGNYSKSYSIVSLDSSKTLATTRKRSFEEVVSSIKEEFSKLFSVGLSVNSSLVNANRLVIAVVQRFCKDVLTSEQILTEVNQCGESCKKNANSFSELALKMHNLLAEMSNLSNNQKEQSILIDQAEKKTFSLRDMIANLIMDTGFKDIAKQIISPRNNLIDLIEDSHIGLNLLSGELPNHVAKYQNDMLEKNHLRELHLKNEFDKLQRQYDEVVNSTQKECTSLTIQIEKLNKDVARNKYQLDLMEKEKTHSKLKFEEELKDSELVAAKLREEILKVKQDADKKISTANDNWREAAESENILQSKFKSLSEEVSLKHELLEKNQEEKSSEVLSLKTYAKKLENDLTKEISKKTHVEDVRRNFVDNIKQLENSLEDAHRNNKSASDESHLLRRQAKDLKESHATDMEEMHEKLNNLSSTLCDKHSEIRSRDLKIMQLQTELQLEEQKFFVTNNESDILRKQIERLQGRIEKLIENRPRGEQAVLLHADGLYNTTMERKQDACVEKVQFEMQKMLVEKDEEMKKLQDTLSSDVLKKNNELERLLKFVERLEDQMVDVTSALRLSKGMAESSTRVASHLESRSASLADLHESSVKLRTDFQRISIDKKDVESSSKFSCLKEDMESCRNATKKARDEARIARLELAKEQQKNSYLQIDLESARSVIDRKNRLQFISSKSLDDSKSEQTSVESMSTILGNSDYVDELG